MYRYPQVTCTQGTNYVDLPSYFSLINSHPSVHCSPVNCFVQWYASVEANTVKIVTSKACVLDIMVLGDRSDAAVANYKDIVDAPVPTYEEEE